MFHSCAKPLLLVIILAWANAYLRALVTLRLSGTVHLLDAGLIEPPIMLGVCLASPDDAFRFCARTMENQFFN